MPSWVLIALHCSLGPGIFLEFLMLCGFTFLLWGDRVCLLWYLPSLEFLNICHLLFVSTSLWVDSEHLHERSYSILGVIQILCLKFYISWLILEDSKTLWELPRFYNYSIYFFISDWCSRPEGYLELIGGTLALIDTLAFFFLQSSYLDIIIPIVLFLVHSWALGTVLRISHLYGALSGCVSLQNFENCCHQVSKL